MTTPGEPQPEPSASPNEVRPEPTGPPAEPPPEPPRSADQPVWRAAILGGLVGAVFSFVLARTFPVVPVVPPLPPPSEARQFADRVIGALQEGKNDEFMGLLKPAFAQMPDQEFSKFCQNLFLGRANAPKTFGPGGQFEFFSESTGSPTLVRVAYLEKYAHGCMLWRLVVYNSPEGWQMTALSLELSDSGFPMLR